VSWEEYEELLEQVGEASWLRISYDEGTLSIMAVSSKHEIYMRFLENLMTALRLRLRINTISSGSATMRKRKKRKGKEPDAGFYVQTAAVIRKRLDLDFEVDPPPDIAVEINLHHDSLDKFPIYVALGVSEIWRFDGHKLTIYHRQHNRYVKRETSLALPLLTCHILTEYLTRLRTEGELQALLAFDEWLQQKQTSDLRQFNADEVGSVV
jgi:Uma2 family endonuclease